MLYNDIKLNLPVKTVFRLSEKRLNLDLIRKTLNFHCLKNALDKHVFDAIDS